MTLLVNQKPREIEVSRIIVAENVTPTGTTYSVRLLEGATKTVTSLSFKTLKEVGKFFARL